MHVFLKTKYIFKYKCMHVYARGYGTFINCETFFPIKKSHREKYEQLKLSLNVTLQWFTYNHDR